MVGSSLRSASARAGWDEWLSGLRDIAYGTGIHPPRTARCYVTDGAHAAVINREYHDSVPQPGKVSVFVGKARDLPAKLGLHLDPWPQQEHSPHHPYQPDEHGVWRLAVRSLSLPARDVDVPADVPADSWAAHRIRIDSPVDQPGGLILVEPLAAVLAGAVEHLHHRSRGQHFQLVFVGADEPTARSLLRTLVDILGAAVPNGNWPTFSTFEVGLPGSTITDRHPDLVFMPHFQPVGPESGRRPTAYVFLAPALHPKATQGFRPPTTQKRDHRAVFGPQDTHVLEFVTPAARGHGASERAARVLVAAYLEGGAARTAEALAGSRNLRTLDLRHVDALKRWADDLEAWQAAWQAGVVSRPPDEPKPPDLPILPTGDESGEHAGPLGSHVFVSYARPDRAYIDKLAEFLRSHGLQVWNDTNIDYGDDWPRMVEENLDGCAAFVVVMSPAAGESEWVRREVRRARTKNKRIFPLLLSGDPLFELEGIHYEKAENHSMPSPRWVAKLLTLVADSRE
jgi:hypothetical protein